MTYYTILLLGGSIVILCCVASIFWFGGALLPFFYKGAPFVPTSHGTTKQMIELARIVDTDRVADLGSGDGRLLLEAARAGAKAAQGYEIHPGLVWISRLSARWQHLHSQITIYQKSFWDADLSDITLVFLYQLPDAVARLEQKLKRELPAGARVVSHAFPFPNWKPEEVRGKIYLYRT